MFVCVCVRVQRSLGSAVEPQSARAPSLRAGDAPYQQLLSGVTDPAQPALLWPVCQLLQWAAEDWASCAAGTFHVGLVAILLERFRTMLILSALYLTFSIILHSWLMNLRWLNTNRFIWTDGLQVLFVFQRAASVLYYYFYKRTSEYLGDPRLYEDSPWLRDMFSRVRQWSLCNRSHQHSDA